MPKRAMVPDYGVDSSARTRTVSFFRSFCFLCCEKSQCYLQYFNFKKSSNVSFPKFDVLKVCKTTLHGFYEFSPQKLLNSFYEFSPQKLLNNDVRMHF